MATKIVNITYQLKRGLQSVIETKNPILAEGEPIVIFCNDGSTKLKIGDGKTSYSELDYVLVDDEGNPLISRFNLKQFGKNSFSLSDNIACLEVKYRSPIKK